MENIMNSKANASQKLINKKLFKSEDKLTISSNLFISSYTKKYPSN